MATPRHPVVYLHWSVAIRSLVIPATIFLLCLAGRIPRSRAAEEFELVEPVMLPASWEVIDLSQQSPPPPAQPVLYQQPTEPQPASPFEQGPQLNDPALQKRLNALEAEVARLTAGENLADERLPSPDATADVMRRLELLEESAAKSAEGKESSDPWIDLSSEGWTVKLGGHMQADYIVWPHRAPPLLSDPAARNYFEFRRLRLLADGVGYGIYDFRLQIDIEPEASENTINPVVEIKDAYLTANELAVVNRVRMGNFFVPFSLEQVTNDTNNIFLERSIPTANIFSYDREVGIAAYNINDAQNFTWTFGAFFDSISESLKERIDDNQGIRLSGRLTWLPYYDEPSNGRYLVHTGTGIVFTDDQNGQAQFRARPQIHEGPFLIDSGPLSTQTYTTSNIEFATVWGPFSLQSETFLTNVNLDGGGNPNLYGAYIHGSYFLTGENRRYERFGQHGAQFGRVVPYSNFFAVPGCCGPGAWELKSRVSWMDLDEIERGNYHDVTTGFNWYWTDRIRWMFDWIHPITSANTVFGPTESDIIAMRLDYNF